MYAYDCHLCFRIISNVIPSTETHNNNFSFSLFPQDFALYLSAILSLWLASLSTP